jgi:DNA repair ATPase RecN
LENELELEKTKEQEYLKEIKRQDKRIKDLLEQLNDEQTRLITISEAYEKLSEKMRKYKGQIEGAVRYL